MGHRHLTMVSSNPPLHKQLEDRIMRALPAGRFSPIYRASVYTIGDIGHRIIDGVSDGLQVLVDASGGGAVLTGELKYGWTLVHVAVWLNRIDSISLMAGGMTKKNRRDTCLKLKVPRAIDAPTDSGWTPLHIACIRGYDRCARLLLRQGACPFVRDRRGNTPLHFASLRCKHLVHTILFNSHADLRRGNVSSQVPRLAPDMASKVYRSNFEKVNFNILTMQAYTMLSDGDPVRSQHGESLTVYARLDYKMEQIEADTLTHGIRQYDRPAPTPDPLDGHWMRCRCTLAGHGREGRSPMNPHPSNVGRSIFDMLTGRNKPTTDNLGIVPNLPRDLQKMFDAEELKDALWTGLAIDHTAGFKQALELHPPDRVRCLDDAIRNEIYIIISTEKFVFTTVDFEVLSVREINDLEAVSVTRQAGLICLKFQGFPDTLIEMGPTHWDGLHNKMKSSVSRWEDSLVRQEPDPILTFIDDDCNFFLTFAGLVETAPSFTLFRFSSKSFLFDPCTIHYGVLGLRREKGAPSDEDTKAPLMFALRHDGWLIWSPSPNAAINTCGRRSLKRLKECRSLGANHAFSLYFDEDLAQRNASRDGPFHMLLEADSHASCSKWIQHLSELLNMKDTYAHFGTCAPWL
eukprot:GHVO01014751.1.p1 GENE.GHVO01014751.1~~GHVO01014751.1.p1  ORF type:complete len:631 (+),score=90.95 GHVO01014751.1:530-2422(+)